MMVIGISLLVGVIGLGIVSLHRPPTQPMPDFLREAGEVCTSFAAAGRDPAVGPVTRYESLRDGLHALRPPHEGDASLDRFQAAIDRAVAAGHELDPSAAARAALEVRYTARSLGLAACAA
jgi:hypothetical protein